MNHLETPPDASRQPIVRGRKSILLQWLTLLGPLAIAGATLCGSFFLVGLAQKTGWIPRPEVPLSDASMQAMDGVQYICPMMCVPPTDAPGRCPVCEMELVAAATGPVFIDPAMRRVLNIQTAPVVEVSQEQNGSNREIRSVGELAFNEESLKTISAYIDGRIEQLHASYTGVKVSAGQPMAVLYSPPLFVAQKELLVAKRNMVRPGTNSDAAQESLYGTSRRRLLELGMTTTQIDALEQAGEANSRLEIVAPIGGTVIEKMAVEGQYVKQGDPIYRLANLDEVWLQLQLFPEDAAQLSVGQPVSASADSLPDRTFEGVVDFISPNINPETRTVSVRVVLPNPQGELRVGDFAQAKIPLPHQASSSPEEGSPMVAVPRDAVLLVGSDSVVYVETEPGRFEMRMVKVGSVSNQEITIADGLRAGEMVARRGNFLIDSQMQLAGNPSLIDPGKALPKKADDQWTPAMEAAIAGLAPADQELAKKQRMCAVADMALGSMGVPVRVEVEGQVVFLCCEGCRSALLKNPSEYLKKLSR
jgi:membrane fusion protein, copper/silver efflux system